MSNYPAGFVISATAPTSPELGDGWDDTTANVRKRWDGSGWVPQGDQIGRGRLTTGEAVFDRVFATTSTSMSSGTLRLVYFDARKTETVTQVRIPCTTGAGATPTLIRAGIYSVDASGSLTLIASTPNDTTLLAANGVRYTKALSASFQKVAGVTYVFGLIVVTAASLPAVGGTAFQSALEVFDPPTMCAVLTAQTDLPASIAVGSLGSTTVRPYAALLP